MPSGPHPANQHHRAHQEFSITQRTKSGARKTKEKKTKITEAVRSLRMREHYCRTQSIGSVSPLAFCGTILFLVAGPFWLSIVSRHTFAFACASSLLGYLKSPNNSRTHNLDDARTSSPTKNDRHFPGIHVSHTLLPSVSLSSTTVPALTPATRRTRTMIQSHENQKTKALLAVAKGTSRHSCRNLCSPCHIDTVRQRNANKAVIPCECHNKFKFIFNSVFNFLILLKHKSLIN